MDRLWAPWRSQFIMLKAPRRCIFCRKRRATSLSSPSESIIEKRRHVFSLLNLYPYNNGHLLVAPYRHVNDLSKLEPVELSELTQLVVDSQRLLQSTLHPHGFNIGMNIGRAAGAGVEGHLHIHIVPRWEGDTNFMSTISGTKVIPQSLAALSQKLRHADKTRT